MDETTWGELTVMGLAITTGMATGVLAGWPIVIISGVITAICLTMALLR